VELEFCPFKDIDKEILNNMDFQPSDHIFEIYGYCKDCKANKK
jgi:Fe2+ or Zn2+ uptake regulation protein